MSIEKKHGGRRSGSGRPHTLLKQPEISRREKDFQKFKFMSDLSDIAPIYQIGVEVPCQTSGCFTMTNQGLWQMRNHVWSIRPICVKCIQEGGHADVVESVKNEAD